MPMSHEDRQLALRMMFSVEAMFDGMGIDVVESDTETFKCVFVAHPYDRVGVYRRVNLDPASIRAFIESLA
jgi:hypothetical protein